jgi:hypothetical protein
MSCRGRGLFTRTVVFMSRSVGRHHMTKLEPIVSVCRLLRRIARCENHLLCKQTLRRTSCFVELFGHSSDHHSNGVFDNDMSTYVYFESWQTVASFKYT